MPSFNVEFRGADKIAQALIRAPQIVEPILQRAIEASASSVFTPSQQAGIVPIKTGFLKKSFSKISGRLFAKIGPGMVYPVNYAIPVHEGSRPHVIVPKSLGYKGHKGGLKTPFGVFNKVKHPGTKANPFMPRILEASKNAVKAHFKRATELIAEAIAKS